MSETPATGTSPALLPLLSRGRHRDPSRGACFMEYTALLADEPFSDRPACVDPKLAAILRGANDTLCDEDRPQLLPLLGRAIGLVVRPDDVGRRPRGPLSRWRGRSRHGGATALAARLHAMVAKELRAAVVGTPSSRSARHRGHAGVSETFWDLMSEPTRARTSHEYSARLVQRLDLLHRCYEDALGELGLTTASSAGPAPAWAVTAAPGNDAGAEPPALVP